MKVTLAQLDYIVGNFNYNYQKIRQTIIDHANDSDLIVFSEMALSGYYVFDLIERPAFIDQQNKYLNQIITLSKSYDCAIVLGCILVNEGKGKPFYNSAVVIASGKVVATYDKQLLPTYNIFNEPRHFQPGETAPVFTYKGKQIGILICEDLWDEDQKFYPKHPITSLKFYKNKIDFIVVLNSSPSEYDKQKERLRLLTGLANQFQVPCFYINQVGGYDEIVYDGASFVISAKGDLIARLGDFIEETQTINLTEIKQNKTLLPLGYLNQEAYYLEQIKLGLRDYVIKCGFKGVVVACSGGIDSALTIAIAVLALGADAVKAITIPSIYSSLGSVEDSKVLCKNLGVRLYERPIKEDYLLSCQQFETSFKAKPSRLTKENMQARIRGRVVMEYSNEFGLLAISCGNKSELSVGYATLYGDMNGGINIIGDLYKTDVYRLANYINHTAGILIPETIINKAPSAELSEGQKDIDSLPPYDLLDALLKLSIEGDLLDKSEVDILFERSRQLSKEEIRRILSLIDRAEFKRKQAPLIIRLQKRSFGVGRIVPVAHQFTTDNWNLGDYGDMMGAKGVGIN